MEQFVVENPGLPVWFLVVLWIVRELLPPTLKRISNTLSPPRGEYQNQNGTGNALVLLQLQNMQREFLDEIRSLNATVNALDDKHAKRLHRVNNVLTALSGRLNLDLKDDEED